MKNIKIEIKWALIFAPIMGIVTSAIVALLTRKKNKTSKSVSV